MLLKLQTQVHDEQIRQSDDYHHKVITYIENSHGKTLFYFEIMKLLLSLKLDKQMVVYI